MAALKIDHDQLFKELLRRFFVEFVEAFLPSTAKYLDKTSIQFLDKEIFDSPSQGERHEVDLVVRCKFKGKPAFFLFHIEHQAQKQNLFGRRMFHYFALLFKKHGLPVYPVVIFSHDYSAPEPEKFTVKFPDLAVLEFRYRVIQLNRLSWRDFLGQKNPAVCALMAKMRIRPKDRPRVKLECLRMLLTLKVDKSKQHFLSAFIDTYLRLTEAEALHFSQEVGKLVSVNKRKQIMQLTTSWEEKGRQEGRKEGQYAIIHRLLTRRCGQLPSQFEDQLRQLSVTNLDNLADALLDFRSLEDLEAWLYRNKV